MVLEATEFSILGIKLGWNDIVKFRDVFDATYKVLEKEDLRWKEVNFCKNEIGVLWDAVVDMLRRLSEEFRIGRQPILVGEEMKKYLFVNTENDKFLSVLGKHSTGLVEEIVWRFKKEFEELKVGSIRSRLYDTISGRRLYVKLNPSKVFKKIERESERVHRYLQQFVEWTRGGGRPIITCMLAAGLFTIALVAGAWIGVAVPSVRPFIMATIAIICWIAETAGMVDAVSAVMRRGRRAGIEIEVETGAY